MRSMLVLLSILLAVASASVWALTRELRRVSAEVHTVASAVQSIARDVGDVANNVGWIADSLAPEDEDAPAEDDEVPARFRIAAPYRREWQTVRTAAAEPSPKIGVSPCARRVSRGGCDDGRIIGAARRRTASSGEHSRRTWGRAPGRRR